MTTVLFSFQVLLHRRWCSLRNALLFQNRWEWAKKLFFVLVGLSILVGLYFGFLRVFRYLEGVLMAGPLLTWKLTAMALLTTFGMVAISGLITSMTTLYYSYDLGFLMTSPVSTRTIFLDKAIETVFYSSWTLALVLVPYVLALGKVKGFGLSFYVLFSGLFIPFLFLAAALGIGFSLLLMYFFPSSRTRDVIWVLSSISFAFMYVLVRFARPERLLRPDALETVAEYLRYLQAPTAPFLPSWWFTKGLMAYASQHGEILWQQAALIFGGAFLIYGGLVWVAGRFYGIGFSGSQEGVRYDAGYRLATSWEQKWGTFFKVPRDLLILFWKDRKEFFRDVKHWSQLLLILALVMVYLFSIRNLPLGDSADLKSFICFLNIGIAGFVIAALSLRFTFPAISLEGKSYWVIKSAPLDVDLIMREKFLFTVFPTLVLGVILVTFSNYFLGADPFVSWLSLGTILVCSWTLCGMGVGLGAMFPRFHVQNIHQIESSAGGFLYMACALGYLAATIVAEIWPIKMHFQERFGKLHAWDWKLISLSVVFLVVLNFVSFVVPWKLGRKVLEGYEGE
ncbi:MAG: hypothetical protein HY399_07365 [Elusimicrobia bacterium]|nr:hypothetical protein [Elusimicrobiota bacterium]